jgi:hypothetical protein
MRVNQNFDPPPKRKAPGKPSYDSEEVNDKKYEGYDAEVPKQDEDFDEEEEIVNDQNGEGHSYDRDDTGENENWRA